MMDFTYSSEQEALRDSVRRFVERQYDWDSRFRIIRSEEGNDEAHWATFAELGWLGAGLSEEEGGFGGGAVENALIAEELGRGLVIEPFVPHVIAAQLLASVGTEQSAELLASTIMGESRIVPALQEVEGRGDWRIVSSRTERGDNGIIITGSKSLVEGAGNADHLIVSAQTEDGIGLYLIDSNAVGVRATPYRTVDNRRVSDVTFASVVATQLCTGRDAGAAIEKAMDHGVLALCGEALGVMDAALWATRDYLKVRKQFGTALSNFQALQHRMADMLIETEMARSILFHALGVAEGNADERAAAVSAAKSVFAKSGPWVAGQAIQLHGGIGVTEELNISHFYRRLFAVARQFGDADLHVDRFAAATDRIATAG